MHRVKKIYELQMNVSVNGRGGRVHITEVVDDIEQVTSSDVFHGCLLKAKFRYGILLASRSATSSLAG